MTEWLFFFRLKTKNLIKTKKNKKIGTEVIRTHNPWISESHTLQLRLVTMLYLKQGLLAIYLT